MDPSEWTQEGDITNYVMLEGECQYHINGWMWPRESIWRRRWLALATFPVFITGTESYRI